MNFIGWLPLLSLACLGAELRFNFILQDQELIQAQITSAKIRQQSFSWSSSTVDLEIRSERWSLAPYDCDNQSCQLQYGFSSAVPSDRFHQKTIPELQRLLQQTTFRLIVDEADFELQLLMLLTWHVADIVDGVDYGATLTIFAKQISVGVDHKNTSTSMPESQDALMIPNGTLQLSSENGCMLELLQVAESQPSIIVEGLFRNGTCTFNGIDYKGPATLGNTNLLFYEPETVPNKCAQTLSGVKVNDYNYMATIAQADMDLCVSLKHENEGFPTVWFEKPHLTECEQDQCVLKFRNDIGSSKTTLVDDGKPLQMLVSPLPIQIVGGPLVIEPGQTWLLVDLSREVDGELVCEYLSISDPHHTFQRVVRTLQGINSAVGFDGSNSLKQIACDISGLELDADFLVKIVGNGFQTLPVMVIGFSGQVEDLYVVYQSLEMWPKPITLQWPSSSNMEGVCVFKSGLKHEITTKFTWNHQQLACPLNQDLFRSGSTFFDLSIRLKDGRKFSARKRVILQPAVNLEVLEGKPTVFRRPEVPDSLMRLIHLQDVNSGQLFPLKVISASSIEFDTCTGAMDVRLVVIFEGEIIQLSTNVIATRACETDVQASEPIFAELPRTRKFEQTLQTVSPVIPAKEIQIQVGLPPTLPDRFVQSPIELLTISLYPDSVILHKGQSCLETLKLSKDSAFAVLNMQPSAKVLCTIEIVERNTPSIYHSALIDDTCGTICYSLSAKAQAYFYLKSDRQLSQRILLGIIDDLVIERVQPENIILMDGLDETVELKITGEFPIQGSLDLALSNNNGEYIKVQVQQISSTVTRALIPQKALKPGNAYVQLRNSNGYRSNQLSLFVQDPLILVTRSEPITCITNSEEPCRIQFLRMVQETKLKCAFSYDGSIVVKPTIHEEGVYSCEVPKLNGKWIVSVGVEGQTGSKQIAHGNSINFQIHEFFPRLVLFSTTRFFFTLKGPVSLQSELYCTFASDQAKTKLKAVDDLTMGCDVPTTNSIGQKLLEVTSDFNRITIGEIKIARFDPPQAVKTTPKILETHRTDQTLLIDFNQIFHGLDVVVSSGIARQRAQLIGSTYLVKVSQIMTVGPVQFEIYLGLPSADLEEAVSIGLTINLLVYPSPTINLANAIQFFHAQSVAQIRLRGQNLFNELDLACLVDYGVIQAQARVNEQGDLICEYEPRVLGKHALEIFSHALNRFIARDGWIKVEPRPVVLQATQQVLFDQSGRVLQPVVLEFDIGLFRQTYLELVSAAEEGKDRFTCPCQTEYKIINCDCGFAPKESVYQLGIRVDSEHVLLSNQLKFVKLPSIIGTSPKVLKPTSEPQQVTLELDGDGLTLVTGVAWSYGSITSDALSWITPTKLQLHVPITIRDALQIQLEVLKEFNSEPILIPISGHFAVMELRVGSIIDESCLEQGACIFSIAPTLGIPVLKRGVSDALPVLVIDGLSFREAVPYQCLLSTMGEVLENQAYFISGERLVCVIPQLTIDNLRSGALLTAGIGLKESDYQVFLESNEILVVDQPLITKVSPQQIYGVGDGDKIITQPVTLKVTGSWTVGSSLMVKFGETIFLATVDQAHAATVLQVELPSIEFQSSSQQAQVCVQVSVDSGANFTNSYSEANAACQVWLVPKPEVASLQFDATSMSLRAFISSAPTEVWLASRPINDNQASWSRVTKISSAKIGISTWEVEFAMPSVNSPLEFGVSKIEDQYVLLHQVLTKLQITHMPDFHVLVPRSSLTLIERAGAIDFFGTAQNEVVIPAPSNLASIVRIQVFNSGQQLKAIQKLLESTFDFVFFTEGATISKNFSFLQSNSQAFIELEITPLFNAPGSQPKLYVRATGMFDQVEQLMSPLIDTGVRLDFTEALVISPVPQHVIIATDLDQVQEIAIDGTGLRFLDGARCNGEYADGVVVVEESIARCLFKMKAPRNTTLTFEVPSLLLHQDALKNEALKPYEIRVLGQSPTISSVSLLTEDSGNLLTVDGDNFVTDLARRVGCSFYAYSPPEQLWHEIATAIGQIKGSLVECPLSTKLKQACFDVALSLEFSLRQGPLRTPRHQLSSALQIGGAFTKLSVKQMKPRLIRGEFPVVVDISAHVGYAEVELESQCLINPLPTLMCSYSTDGATQVTYKGLLRWPIASCPVVYLGEDHVDLTLQLENLASTRVLINKAIGFDQGSLKIMEFSPTLKLASQNTQFVFMLSEPQDGLQCVFKTQSGTVAAEAVIQNLVARCTCPPVRDNELLIEIRLDGESVPFAGHSQIFEKVVPVIHVEQVVIIRREFINQGNQKVKLRGSLDSFEFCVFRALQGTNLYYSELSKTGPDWQCNVPAQVARTLNSALVSLQPFESEELTEGITIRFTEGPQISHAYYDEAGTLTFALTGEVLESTSCLFPTQAGGVTTKSEFVDGVYRCETPTDYVPDISQFQIGYVLPGDARPYTSEFVSLLQVASKAYSFITSSLGLSFFKSVNKDPPVAVCKYILDGYVQFTQLQLLPTMKTIWIESSSLDVTKDRIYVCEQLMNVGQLIETRTATELLQFKSNLTKPLNITMTDHKTQVSSPGHLAVYVKTDFDGYCSVESCLDEGVYSKLAAYKDGIRLCMIQNLCVRPSNAQLMVSESGLVWQTLIVPVQIRAETPQVLTWWPTVIATDDKSQNFTFYGTDLRSDLALRIQGQMVEFHLVSSREITFAAKIKADQNEPDLILCRLQGQSICIGPQFDVMFELVQINPISGEEQIHASGKMQLRVKRTLSKQVPASSQPIPAFTLHPTAVICGVKTTLRVRFEAPVETQLRFKNFPLVMESENEGNLEVMASCKAANLTSTEVRLGDRIAMVSVTKQYQISFVDGFFKPINDSDLFRVMVQSLQHRLSCVSGFKRGTVEVTAIKDLYKCNGIEEDQELRILVDEVVVASFVKNNLIWEAFQGVVVHATRIEYQLGSDKTFEAQIFLATQEETTQIDQFEYICSYEGLDIGRTFNYSASAQGSFISCELPDKDQSQSYELKLMAGIGPQSYAIWSKQILVLARPEIIWAPEVLFEGGALKLELSPGFDKNINLTCFGHQGTSRLRRAPAIRQTANRLSCHLRLEAGVSVVYLGIDSTPITQNKVAVRMIPRPKIFAIKPASLYISPQSLQDTSIQITGQFEHFMIPGLRVSVEIQSAERGIVLTHLETSWAINNEITSLLFVIPSHQMSPGTFSVILIGSLSDALAELGSLSLQVLQAIEFDYSPKIVCTGVAPTSTLLTIRFSDRTATHCLLSNESQTLVMLVEACEAQSQFSSVSLGRLIDGEFIAMTDARPLTFRGPVTIDKAYVDSNRIMVEGKGFMQAFRPDTPVYCEVKSRSGPEIIDGNLIDARSSYYKLPVFIVNDSVVECSLPTLFQELTPKTYSLRLMTEPDSQLYLRTYEVLLKLNPKTKILAQKWEVWMAENMRQNDLTTNLSKAQFSASDSQSELVVMAPSLVVFSFELPYSMRVSISCRIRRSADNQVFQVPDKASVPHYQTQVSCPPVPIGPETEFFAGQSDYVIQVSFDGFYYETAGEPVNISVRQPSVPNPICRPFDVVQQPLKQIGPLTLATYSMASSKCLAYVSDQVHSPRQNYGWQFFDGPAFPILALDQGSQQFNLTSAYFSKRPQCEDLTYPYTLKTVPAISSPLAKSKSPASRPILTLYLEGAQCEGVYDVPQTISPFKYTSFLHGNKTDGLYQDAYTFYTLPTQKLTCFTDVLIEPPSFKLYERQPVVIHQSRLPFYVFEDQATLSDQTLQADLISITLMGQNFSKDMTCLLISQSGQVFEQPLLKHQGPTKAMCSLAAIVQEQFNQNQTTAWISLKDKNGNRSHLLDLDKNVFKAPLEVTFVPRLTISLASSDLYYFANLDQTIKLLLSYPAVGGQCEFKSQNYTTRTELTDMNECPVPQLSGQDSQVIELSVRQQLNVMTTHGLTLDYTYSNKLLIQFTRLPRITTISPLEVPAMTSFYNQAIHVYGSDFRVGSYIVLRPLEGNDHFQGQAYSFQRRHMPRIDSQWIVIRDFTVISDTHGTFKAPYHMTPGTYSVQVATESSISDDQIALNFIKLPEISRLIPPLVPQIAVSDTLGSTQGHKVVLEGRNFTEYSQCVVQSYIISSGLTPTPKDTLVPTVWISPDYLQCTIFPQQFAPFSYSGNSVKIRVLERSLYLNVETQFDLYFTNQPYVWKVEPNQAYLGSPNTMVRVYVAQQESNLVDQFLFCSFGDSDISKVTKVETLQDPENECTLPDFYESGSSGHIAKPDSCRTSVTVFHCKTPNMRRVAGYITKIEILNSQGQFTHTVLGSNSFEFLATPLMKKAQPQVLPIVDLTLQPLAAMARVQVIGDHFNSAAVYECVFKKASVKYVSQATFMSNTQLTCDVPYVAGFPVGVREPTFITVELQLSKTDQGANIAIRGVANIKLYKQPTINEYWPKVGSMRGGTVVTISGANLDPTLGGIRCKFGNTQVEAVVFSVDRIVQCVAPNSITLGKGVLSISVDGGVSYFNHFQRNGTVLQASFIYIPDSFAATSILNRVQDFWGHLDVVIQTSLPYSDLLNLSLSFGLAKVEVKCRFDFSDSDRIETVGTVYQNSIVCPLSRHLVQDHRITLAVSFNNQEFVTITTNLELVKDVREFESVPLYSIATPDLYSNVLSLQYADGVCPDIYQLPSEPFHTTIAPLWDNELNILIKIDAVIHSIPCKTREQFQQSLTELQQKASTTGTFFEFKVDALVFRFYYRGMSEHVNRIYEKLFGLYQWLCSQETAILACSDTKELMVSIIPYYDPSTPLAETDTRLSCKVGSYNFQAFVAKNEVMVVECMVNVANYVQRPSTIDITFTVDSLTPKFAFIDELNVKLYLVVRPLYDLSSLRCKLNDVVLQGTYVVVNGTPKVQCILPSLIYLHENSQQVPADGVWSVTVSLDAITFSNQAYSFKYIDSEQIKALSVFLGPETGGTIVTLQVRDLAPVDGTDLPQVFCKFPGFETDPSQIISAQFILLNTITCQVPPLNPKAVDPEFYAFSPMFTTVRVQLDILGYRVKEYFTFTYMKDLAIERMDPPNFVFDLGTDIQTAQPIFLPASRTVKVIGRHFLPTEDQLFCRVGFGQPVIIQATYRFNNTVECDIPPPPIGAQLPLNVPIELSFNQGQQFTTSNVQFYYTPQDRISHIYPTRQYVKGNQLVKVFTPYFFDKGSTSAKCKFKLQQDAQPDLEYIASVVGFDSEGVMCYHPPAYLLSSILAQQGGDTLVEVSSNGIDFSTNTAQRFTYKKAVLIREVHPPFILMDQQVVVSLIGENFYSVDDTNLLKVRLTRIVTDASMASLSYVVEPPQTKFISGQLVTFVFPSGVFNDKDFINVELTFDEITWDTAESARVVVYKQITLTKIRPSYVYTGYGLYEVVLQAEPFTNAQGIWQKGGSIWEMEQFNWLQCRFQSQRNQPSEQKTQGYFFNSTHVGCPLPGFQTADKVMVDLTIDQGVTYSSNKVGVYLINEPTIVSLNNTEYYYTYNERVFIELQGTNLDKSGFLYVRVGDQVQSVQIIKDSGSSTVVFEMPSQLDLGTYLIAVSTDGITYRPDPQGLSLPSVTVLKCPNGFTCSQEVKTICPQGYFCPHNELQVHQKRQCPLGTYMTGEGASECIQCGAGKFCPNIRLYVEQACPVGFLCQQASQYSVTQLKECPAGYVCKPDFTEKLNPDDLFASSNMKPCPLGFYCPKGSIEFAMTTHYGNFTTPQVCRDGRICAQNANELPTQNQPGAFSQYGSEACPVGYFCQRGRRAKCPKGFKCPKLGGYEPEPCPPGYFQSNTTQTTCEQCPVGTFCYFAQMSLPIKCTPGWVCQMKAGMAPAQLCPAGSFCNLATVTNQTNSTVEELYKPNFCYQSSYCLAGVYTPFVNKSNQQAAQSCIAGTFCAEGSASPEGKGKCKEGFYCPANSIEMIPTEPGYFAQGTGNVAPEKCRPGTYQNQPQQADCIQCPIGYFCPDQMMTSPKICGAGEFSMYQGSTQCAKCPLGTYSDQIGVTSEESCFQCEARFLCTNTGLTTMRNSQACIEGYYCGYGTTNTIMLNSKVQSGYYGGYNITGLAEFNLCLEGKYCPSGTAVSKVKQLDCLRGFFCPIGTMADLDLNGNFRPGVRQVDRNILINAVREYLAESIKQTALFKQNITDNRLDQQLNFYRANKDKYLAQYNRLEWEFYKYALNQTIIAERQKYLETVLLTDIRCEEDKFLPEPLIKAYIRNGTNLVCPRGTESDRGSWCIGQCKINLASKIPMSILNPVKDIVGITSLSMKDQPMSTRVDLLGSEFTRLHPDWENEKERKYKDSLFGQSPWAKGSSLNPFRQLNSTEQLSREQQQAVLDDLSPHERRRVLRAEELKTASRQAQRNLQLNSQNRNYDIVGGGVFDTIHVQTLKPLEIARLNFNLTVLPDKLLYNDHFEIKILNEDDVPFKLPVYFSVENNKVTNKRALLQIRIFNWTEQDQVFKVALYLYHALFIPYLEILSDKMWVEVYNAERQTRGTNMTHGVIITEQQFEGITLPYNTPDYGNDPSLWLDFVSTNQPDKNGNEIPSQFRVNPTTKGLDKDIFDPTYWQSKQINAVIMPWLPFFSNCDGFDSRIIIYDAFEYARNCTLEDYDQIRIVNPLPTQGLNPRADHCTLDITCRYDEQLTVSNSMTTRWFQIREEKTLGYITRNPIPIENFWKIEDSDVHQTFYNSLIEDGSDDIVFINFIPTDTSGERIPRLVEVDFLYYQKSIDVKVVQSVKVYLKEYDEPMQPGEIPEVGYRLKINYKPLNFLNLINTFQFAFPIYILLFNLVALILVLSVLTFWLFVLLFTRTRKPPALRFKHLSKVIFTAPAVGTLLSCLPAFVAALVIILYTKSTLFHNLSSNWMNMGNTASAREIIQQQRGRSGLMLVIVGFIFLHYGAQTIVYKPTEEEEEQILAHQHKLRKLERIDLSIDDKIEAIKADEEKEAKEENKNIRNALDWKRRHFFVTCIFVTCFLMLKIEFSYTKIFSNNITYFLTGFMVLDILTEQVLVRRVMSEALLVAPMLGTFAVVEFVMTMGANDFRSFIISYFISFSVTTFDRVFIGPFVEKLEAWTQIVIIHLSRKNSFIKRIFEKTLIKQLAAQLQLMSLNEYNDKRIRNEDKADVVKRRKFYDWQLEKGEGAEALLGTMMTYTTQTQALFLIPETLLLIIFLANETKIPQKYTIRKSDLTYYFIFTAVIIIPNLIIDIFVLHTIEIIQGYKIFDYFTYCDYRYNVRTKKWLSGRRMDKSLNHHMRSLDSLMFSSQYYYIINLSTWSIIFMYLGVTAINRNLYNPFADPILVPVMVSFPFAAIPLKWLLAFVSDKAKVWAPQKDVSQRIDVSLFNRLDVANNQKRIINNMQTNPFRHKFIMVNREWLVSNIADVLGGRTYVTEAGAEMDYLKHIYQTAINTQNLTKKMEVQQKALAKKLEMLPYNYMKGNVEVSEDRLSDEPFNDWDLPPSLAQPHVLRVARMWIDFARQQIRLKFMVADIVQSKLKNRCQKCKERFRLQVIQKHNFTTLTRKFMEANVGIPFSQPRWRRFFSRRQLFTTLCMECAYIENLQAGGLREENPKLQEFLAEHALRLLDQNDDLVRKKLKLPHVRRVIYKWLQMARASLLHKERGNQDDSKDERSKTDSTLDYF